MHTSAAPVETMTQAPGAPYRATESPTPRLPTRHRALGARELIAWLALPMIVDLGVWSSDAASWSFGGLGLAVVYALFALALASAAPRIRWSRRLALVSAVLALLIVRMASLPTDAANLVTLATLCAMPFVLRSRQISPLEAGLGAVAAVPVFASRVGAALRGVGRLALGTNLGLVALLPIAIPAALITVFVAVLAGANPMVAEGLGWVLDRLGELLLPPFARVALWGLALTAGLALLRPVGARAAGREAAISAGPSRPTERAVARNSLAGLVAVFVVYLALDAIHLAAGRPPEGVTTQIYAHLGAFWLTVALAMLTGTVGWFFRGELAHDPEAHGVRRLAYAWTGLGLVLAVATYARLGIHIHRSGLSDLRLIGILGITSVVVGMVLTVVKLARRRTLLWLVRRQLEAIALAVVVYALLPTHWLSAGVNVARIEAGSYGALLHVAPEARHAEAARVYLPLLDHPDPRVREGVAAILSSALVTFEARLSVREGWRAADLVTEPAVGALRDARPRLDAALDGANAWQAEVVLARMAEAAALDAPRAGIDAIAPAPRR
jgi:hypothetical protein